MSKDRLSKYVHQRDILLADARDRFKGRRAYVYGSVIRAQGPFNDIDVAVLSSCAGESDASEGVVEGLPIQIDYIDSVLSGEVVGSRDITVGLDYAVVADEGGRVIKRP